MKFSPSIYFSFNPIDTHFKGNCITCIRINEKRKMEHLVVYKFNFPKVVSVRYRWSHDIRVESVNCLLRVWYLEHFNPWVSASELLVLGGRWSDGLLCLVLCSELFGFNCLLNFGCLFPRKPQCIQMGDVLYIFLFTDRVLRHVIKLGYSNTCLKVNMMTRFICLTFLYLWFIWKKIYSHTRSWEMLSNGTITEQIS